MKPLMELQEVSTKEWRKWSLLHRLLTRLVEDDAGCWLYQGAITPHGYGTISTGGRGATRQIVAHRVAWTLLVGEIEPNMVLDHLCGVRRCCNPEHLEPVSSATNSRRKKTAKLTWEKVEEIRDSDESLDVLAKRFGITRTHVKGVREGRSWMAD